jgi:type I restriction-modification system DNA methylase subunit
MLLKYIFLCKNNHYLSYIFNNIKIEKYYVVMSLIMDCAKKSKKNVKKVEIKDEENVKVCEDKNEPALNDKSVFKTHIRQFIENAHNTLYHNENICGERALNDIMNLLFLKIINNKLSETPEEGKFDILNVSLYKPVNIKMTQESINSAIEYFKDLNKIVNEKTVILRNSNELDVIKQMGKLLKFHPITCKIFTNENFLNCEKATTIQTLLKVILKIDIQKLEENEDVIGDIYEYFINNYNKSGSMLGQFFTPRKLMNLLLNFKKDYLQKLFLNNEKIDVYDPTMGTGGFLIMPYNIFKEYQYKITLSGMEISPNTFQYGLMNIIMTLKKMPKHTLRDNSLMSISNVKYDLIVSNPPFQTSMPFENIVSNFNVNFSSDENYKDVKIDDVFKLKSNSPPMQFLELCIYKLKPDGICIIILPYGEIFNGKSHKKNRLYLLNTIEILDIIVFQNGIFENTDIKTCAMIFKKSELKTQNIDIYNCDDTCSNITKMISLTKKQILNESIYSFSFNDYIVHNPLTLNVEMVEFEKVFELEKGKLQSSKIENSNNGTIQFITKSEINDDSLRMIEHNEYYENGLFIAYAFNGNGKCPIRYTENKCVHSNLMCRIILKEEYKNRINLKYYYYYLKSINEYIELHFDKGACNKVLDVKNFNRMKIPLINIEEQNNIINSITMMQLKIIESKNEIVINEKIINILLKIDCKKNLSDSEIEIIKKNKKIFKNKKYNENNEQPLKKIYSYQMSEITNPKNEFKKYIKTFIISAHNLLYNTENISGERALNDIMNLLFLKIIENKISEKNEDGKFDLFNVNYYSAVRMTKNGILKSFEYFKNLKSIIEENELCIRDKNEIDVVKQMGNILKNHPITNKIFTDENFLHCEKSSTLKKLLSNILNIDINKLEENEDVIGDIYEYFVNVYNKSGSMLGQFFTPRKLMNLLLNFKKDYLQKLFINNETIDIYDPTMGTGGFLIMPYNIFKEYQHKITLSGMDIQPNTFQYGLMNIIMTLKKMPKHTLRDNSLMTVSNFKYDLIVSNPPFQTSMKFNNIIQNFNLNYLSDENYKNVNIDDVYKLKSDTPPIQFLELCIYKLKNEGICVIILPYGSIFNGSKHKNDRLYLLNTIEILDIIVFQNGIFENTNIKTCALIFKKSNTKTQNINFYECDKDCSNLQKIITLSREQILNESQYSFYFSDYLLHETLNSNIKMIEFEKMFELEKGKLQSSKIHNDSNGLGYFINLSKNNDHVKIKNYDYENSEGLFISNTSPLGLIKYFQGNFSFSNLLYKININKEYKNKINIKYYYYYFQSISEYIVNFFSKGSCNKVLDIKNFNRMKIPYFDKMTLDIFDKINEKNNILKKSIIECENIINKLIYSNFKS